MSIWRVESDLSDHFRAGCCYVVIYSHNSIGYVDCSHCNGLFPRSDIGRGEYMLFKFEVSPFTKVTYRF